MDKEKPELESHEQIFIRELANRGNYTYPKWYKAQDKKILHLKLIRLGYLTGMLRISDKGRERAKSIK